MCAFTDHGSLKFRETAQVSTQYTNNSGYCIIYSYYILKTRMIKRKVTKAKIRNSADESNDSPLGFEATLWAAACKPSFAVLGRFSDERRRRLFAAGVVFALFGGAMAGPLEDGRAAYQRGDYGMAMRLLRSPRANHVAEAQRDMGLMYAQGQGVKQDFAQALIWFRKAADQGDDLAQFFLGVMYRDGNGVPKDDAKALAWYRKSADQGDSLAQFDIGSMYNHGEGVPKDAAQAAAWYRKAADQGSASAQSNLGAMYSEGDGVPKDDAQALIWFHKAADQGEAVALFNLGLANAKGAGVPQDSALAAVWYRKAADKGKYCPDQSWLLV